MLRLSTCRSGKIARSEERQLRSIFISSRSTQLRASISARPRKRSTNCKNGLRTNKLVEEIGQAAQMIRPQQAPPEVYRWLIAL